MIKRTVLSLCLLTGTLCAQAAADGIIEKARSRLGSEEALKRVESLRFDCTWLNAEGEKVANLTLYFKEPQKQRIDTDLVDGAMIKARQGFDQQVTAINGYEGFNRFINSGTDEWRLSLLEPEEVFRLATNTMENLHFYRGAPRMRGKIVDGGLETFQGEQAHVVEFRYPKGIVYRRYFDPETGDLIGTEMPLGGQSILMLEEGEQEVSGITFPKKTETYQNRELVRTIRFDKIVVNAEIDDKVFEVPSMSASN